MTLIIDTHIFLWLITGERKFSRETLSTLANTSNVVYFSAASAWEIAIKRELGKLEAPDSLLTEVSRMGFTPLPITLKHAEGVANLLPIHRDPFDRLLISQALVENAVLVTVDQNIVNYPVETIGI